MDHSNNISPLPENAFSEFNITFSSTGLENSKQFVIVIEIVLTATTQASVELPST